MPVLITANNGSETKQLSVYMTTSNIQPVMLMIQSQINWLIESSSSSDIIHTPDIYFDSDEESAQSLHFDSDDNYQNQALDFDSDEESAELLQLENDLSLTIHHTSNPQGNNTLWGHAFNQSSNFKSIKQAIKQLNIPDSIKLNLSSDTTAIANQLNFSYENHEDMHQHNNGEEDILQGYQNSIS